MSYQPVAGTQIPQAEMCPHFSEIGIGSRLLEKQDVPKKKVGVVPHQREMDAMDTSLSGRGQCGGSRAQGSWCEIRTHPPARIESHPTELQFFLTVLRSCQVECYDNKIYQSSR